MDDDMEEVLIGSSGYTEQVRCLYLYRHAFTEYCIGGRWLYLNFQVSSRKSYKHDDMEDEEETVVLFSREGEGSHDLDWSQI